MAELRWVPVGKIGRAHGVHGVVRVIAYGETLSSRTKGDKLYLRPSGGAVRELTLDTLTWHQRAWLAHFVGFTSREATQELTGQELFLPEDQLPQLEEGEYYHYQLIGLKVETVDGSFLGLLREILPAGSHDVYVVEHDGKEILIPATEQVVLAIDLQEGRMRVALPEGLIDDL
jgi:16S rRNA processing protein RimM